MAGGTRTYSRDTPEQFVAGAALEMARPGSVGVLVAVLWSSMVVTALTAGLETYNLATGRLASEQRSLAWMVVGTALVVAVLLRRSASRLGRHARVGQMMLFTVAGSQVAVGVLAFSSDGAGITAGAGWVTIVFALTTPLIAWTKPIRTFLSDAKRPASDRNSQNNTGRLSVTQ